MKLYRSNTGGVRGDALITYANVSSVDLALEYLHEHDLRGNRLCVQKAEFQEVEQKTNEELTELAKQQVYSRESVGGMGIWDAFVLENAIATYLIICFSHEAGSSRMGPSTLFRIE